MLTDSSLTNILIVSGVSQIRYRAYCQSCSRLSLFNYFKNTTQHDNKQVTLLKAYTDLISLNIPAFWRISSESTEPGTDFILELWVFWFDERHTGKIDANDDLDALEEIKVGSFTWENAYSKIQSPTASPVPSSTQSNSSTPVTVSDEYKWFIKSIRNLIQAQMKSKGAIPLGEFYIFPNSTENIIDQAKSSLSNPLSMTDSVLCCSYSIYLASTNLILQPNTRRMRVAPITSQTIQSRGKKVIISPSGEIVQIASNRNYILPQQIEENILRKWSILLEIPYDHLIQSNSTCSSENKDRQQPKDLPNLVSLKSITGGEPFYYPTSLIFVSTSSRMSPTAMGGTNGLSRYNQGYTEDLGDKWHRWAWSERISNFWEYSCPRESTTSIILDSLSQDSGNINSNSGLLQRAINEPVTVSPLMAAKSVATPGSATGNFQRRDISTPSSASMQNYDEESEHQYSYQQQNHQPQPNQQFQRNKARFQTEMSLIDFAMSNFVIPNNMDDLVEYPIMNNAVNVVHDASILQQQIPQQAQPIQPQFQNQQNQNAMYQANQLNKIDPNPNKSLNVSDEITATTNNSTYQSPLELEAFGIVDNMDVDNMVLDLPNRWDDDGMGDLDNFDFGVTEEDFDFFESSGPVVSMTAAPVADATVMGAPIASSTLPTANDNLLSNDHSLMLQNNLVKQEDNLDFQVGSELFDNNIDLDQKHYMMDTDIELPHEVSVTPLEVGMVQQNSFIDQLFDQNQPMQEDKKLTPMQLNTPTEDVQQQMFVPPNFAPVKLDSMVNDSKYISGGKFTYTPGAGNIVAKNKKRVNDYRPDYIPALKKNKNRKKSTHSQAMDKSGNVDAAKSFDNIASTQNESSKHSYSSKNDTHENDLRSEDMSMDDDGSEEESSYSTDDTSSDSTYEDDSEEDTAKSTRAMDALSQAQEKYIQKLTSLEPLTTKKSIVSVDQVVMDYDSPFARTVSSSIIRLPNSKVNINDQDEIVALDYLCQQAVRGGYPFSGGIESMSSNGFEANEGESPKVLVARRRNLLQKFNGDTVHIPSTPDDVDLITQRFKNSLSEIFSQQKKNSDSIDDMCIDQLPLPASVTVKGPLNVQQYYDLSETNQAHSKYGKYQVKKRRPAEPNLDTLQPPNITVSRQDDFIEGTSNLIMFWEKLRLEPYSSKKNINYFVLFPKNDSIESHVSQFFKGLSTLYETCQLGVHYPGNVGPYRKGLVPVPLLPAMNGESFEQRQMRSYLSVCQSLGSEIGGTILENVHIVIYIINPTSYLSSNLELSRCFTKLMTSYHEMASGLGVKAMDKSRARIVLQLMPIEHLLRYSSFGGCLKFGLKEIAFSVYSKCHSTTSRQHNQTVNGKDDRNPVTCLYAPPFVLSKSVPDQIQFSLKKSVSAFPTILEDQDVLHMGYSFSLDKRWMIIVWTDNRGEMVEFAIIDNRDNKMTMTTIFEDAWKRTKQISKLTGFAWTFVIAKMGLMFEEELKAWISFLPAEEKIAIISLDTESTLHISSSSAYDSNMMNDLSMNSSLSSDTLGASTPNMMNANGVGGSLANKKSFTEDNHQTKALLLNHRVAYSNKRERMSFGVLGMDSTSIEDWMIPLASGYMIHTSPTTENPNNELFNCNPLILEVHLVYNQTNHSAYSTLRDIIKKYHALSYLNAMPSNNNCFPIHLLLVERLCRILLVANP